MKNNLLVSTRKGLIAYKRAGNTWQVDRVSFQGIPVSIAYVDERDGTWWACLDHGHWGTKLHRSKDAGANWEEVAAPAFPEGEEVKEGVPAAVKYLWAMHHGGADHPGHLYLGTEPGGLFRSTDGGDNFKLVESLWNLPHRKDWFGGGRDNAGIHSIVVDPRDSNHFYIAVSCAGVFETTDGGVTWNTRNKGMVADFLPDPDAEIGQDPHLLVASKSNPDVLWNQNHCGIFRSTNGGKLWENITEKDGPANFGFTIATDEKDDRVAWVVPAVSDGIRIAIDGALVVCRTDDGGQTWQQFRAGLPQENCFDIVYRHALDITGDTLVFGTTTGNLFVSNNRGESWEVLSNYLPMVYAVHFA